MKILSIIIKVIGVMILVFLLLFAILLLWLNINDKIVKDIEKMENQGIMYINRINKLVSSILSWKVKREAMYAIDKIRDESSIPVLINLLYSKRNLLLYWLDYQEVNETDAFREEVTYVLVNYGDSVFEHLLLDLEKKGPRRVSDNILYALGLLRMEEATNKLRNLSKNPEWALKHETIVGALRLAEQKKNNNADQKVLLNKDKIDEAIMELNLAIKGEIGLIQEVHFVSVIEDLGRLKVEASRDVLKEIIQKKHSEILKISAIKALGKIGNQGDAEFLIPYIYHEDIDIRREAIIALGAIGSEHAIADLEEVLKRRFEAPRNKFLAREALKKIYNNLQ